MPVQYLNTGHSAGEEASSTYEGRHITIEESLIHHPEHLADGWVNGGDPVVVGGADGHIVGVAFESAAANTDLIAIDTEGIWYLSVVGITDNAVAQAVDEGDIVYINTTTAVLSKISNWATQVPFGYALGEVDAGATQVVAVKVHWSPSNFNNEDNHMTVTDGDYSWSVRSVLDGGASEGMNGYVEGHLTDTQTGNLYGFGSWINVDGAGYLDGSLITPFEGGIYAGDAQAAGRVVFAGQHQAILAGAPASLHAWRLNSTQDITALIATANPGTAGYQPGTAGTGVVGTVPLFDVVGHGVLYADLHAAVA